MAKGDSSPVWLKWFDGGQVIRAAHASVEDAQLQASMEAKPYLGVYSDPDDHSDNAKLADAKGSHELAAASGEGASE